MADIDFPDNLIALERSAWEEIQAGALTPATAQAAQTAVTAFAAEAGLDRYTVEMRLKQAVRHAADA